MSLIAVPEPGKLTRADSRPPPHHHGHRSTTNLPHPTRRTGTDDATTGMVPTFTKQSIGQGGAQLYSGSIAMPTPQAFNMASPPLELHGFGV